MSIMVQTIKKRIFNSAYKEKGIDNVIKLEVIQVTNGAQLKVVFESQSSSWRQGIWLKTDKGIVVNNILCPSCEIWADTAPEEVFVECKTDNGYLNLYNIWDRGNGRESQAWSSGMLEEEIELGRRYKCNDIGFKTEFDRLVFQIHFLK